MIMKNSNNYCTLAYFTVINFVTIEIEFEIIELATITVDS